jgi:hypothetical protein
MKKDMLRHFIPETTEHFIQVFLSIYSKILMSTG